MTEEKPPKDNPMDLVKAVDSALELIQDSNQNMSPVRKKKADPDEPVKLKVCNKNKHSFISGLR